MSNFKTKWKVFWRIVGECFMRSLTPSVMFFVAGLVLLMLQSKNFGLSAQMAWAALCAVVALAYNGFLMWICGGNHYEMLVSGNLKRRSAMQSGSELNMASYKFQKEYRPWKGFAIGAFVSLLLIVGSIVLGCNQTAIVEAATNEEVTLLPRGLGAAAHSRTEYRGHGGQLFRGLRFCAAAHLRFRRLLYRRRLRPPQQDGASAGDRRPRGGGRSHSTEKDQLRRASRHETQKAQITPRLFRRRRGRNEENVCASSEENTRAGYWRSFPERTFVRRGTG